LPAGDLPVPTMTRPSAETFTKWNVSVPELDATEEPRTDQDWWHLSKDITIVKIPRGSVISITGQGGREFKQLTFREDFWISDREITVRLFQEFMADENYRGMKPVDWNGPQRFPDVSAQEQLSHP
jgi:formylglycine-generating enzyme required for sulfatase activity